MFLDTYVLISKEALLFRMCVTDLVIMGCKMFSIVIKLNLSEYFQGIFNSQHVMKLKRNQK